MRKNGFAPLMLILVIAILAVVGYKNYLKSKPNLRSPSNLSPVDSPLPKLPDISNIVIPNIIDQWNPQITWDNPTTGSYQVGWMEKPANGVIRKGTISNSDRNPYNPQIDSKIASLGWQLQLPVGASGPIERIDTYLGYKNGSSKVFVIDVKMMDDSAKTLPTYKNSITVFQEQ